MLNKILEDCKKQLCSALIHKKHPFRFFTLATKKKDGHPKLRTVVLRNFNPKNFEFVIFSDSRSSKVNELKKFPEAQFLFYDPSRLIQLIFDIKLKTFSSEPNTYNLLPESSKKDYSSILNPGTIIKNPDEIEYDFSKNYFIKIVFEAEKIEYLKLKRPNHIRSIYSIEDNWSGKFLAP